MRSADVMIAESYYIKVSPELLTSFDHVKEILDAKYEPADLDKVVEKSTHLSKNEQEKSQKLLMKYGHLFDGTLGAWTRESYEIELKEDATPFHSSAYPIPKVHKKTLKHEVQCFCEIGILKRSIAQNRQHQPSSSQRRTIPFASYPIFTS